MFQSLMLVLRALLTLVGAVALLFFLSYPDTVLPPSADAAYATGFSIYQYKPVIWVLPLLFMEVVNGFGPKRNMVWFFALETVLVAGIILWPVLHAHAPEWVERTLPFEDGKLPVGLGYLAVILFASVLFRRVLLDFLFKAPRSDEDDPTMMDAAVLDPAKGRTVREIVANPTLVKPRFLFGEADYALIARFYALVRRLNYFKGLKALLGLLGLVAVGLWFWFYPQPTEQQAFRRDLAAMYEFKRLPNGGYIGTHRAVHAAYRAMKYAADHKLLEGLSYEAVAKLMGADRAPEDYRRQLLDRSDISLPSVDNMFESRTRLLTVSDGRRIAVLYVRPDESGERVSIAEVQDAGWNQEMDEYRRRFGQEVLRF